MKIGLKQDLYNFWPLLVEAKYYTRLWEYRYTNPLPRNANNHCPCVDNQNVPDRSWSHLGRKKTVTRMSCPSARSLIDIYSTKVRLPWKRNCFSSARKYFKNDRNSERHWFTVELFSLLRNRMKLLRLCHWSFPISHELMINGKSRKRNTGHWIDVEFFFLF